MSLWLVYGSFPARSHQHRWLAWKFSASQVASSNPISHPTTKEQSINHKIFGIGTRLIKHPLGPDLLAQVDEKRFLFGIKSIGRLEAALSNDCRIDAGCRLRSFDGALFAVAVTLLHRIHASLWHLINFNLKVTNTRRSFNVDWKHLFAFAKSDVNDSARFQERENAFRARERVRKISEAWNALFTCVQMERIESQTHFSFSSHVNYFVRLCEENSYFNLEILLLLREYKSYASQLVGKLAARMCSTTVLWLHMPNNTSCLFDNNVPMVKEEVEWKRFSGRGKTRNFPTGFVFFHKDDILCLQLKLWLTSNTLANLSPSRSLKPKNFSSEKMSRKTRRVLLRYKTMFVRLNRELNFNCSLESFSHFPLWLFAPRHDFL